MQAPEVLGGRYELRGVLGRGGMAEVRDGWDIRPPETLIKGFRLLVERDGDWDEVVVVTDNFQRLVRIPLEVETAAIRLQIDETWGSETPNVFGWEVEEAA